MTKDYSWIKQGMYCSLEDIEPNSDLELQIIDAFVKAGAYKDEDRGYEFDCELTFDYEFAGWGKGGTCLIDREYLGYYECNQLVSVDFILNGGVSSQEAITDTLDEGNGVARVEGETSYNAYSISTETPSIEVEQTLKLKIGGQVVFSGNKSDFQRLRDVIVEGLGE